MYLTAADMGIMYSVLEDVISFIHKNQNQNRYRIRSVVMLDKTSRGCWLHPCDDPDTRMQ